MAYEDDVSRLVGEGLTQNEIADRLAVSKQRISQIVKKLDLKPVRKPYVWKPKERQPQTIRPRVITGGVQAPINASVGGMISELLVAADLMARGWKVFLPVHRSAGHDILATRPTDGKIVTFEVRSAHRGPGGGLTFSKLSRDKSDHYALVCTGEPVDYRPALD